MAKPFKTVAALMKKMEDRLTIDAVDNAHLLVTRATLMVESEAKQSLARGGQGRIYQKYNPRREHRASAPNQPPATDTGFLASNIGVNVRKEKAHGRVIGQVISKAPYSAALEFGTKDMLALGGPRPFMQPALQSKKAAIKRLFKGSGVLK